MIFSVFDNYNAIEGKEGNPCPVSIISPLHQVKLYPPNSRIQFHLLGFPIVNWYLKIIFISKLSYSLSGVLALHLFFSLISVISPQTSLYVYK